MLGNLHLSRHPVYLWGQKIAQKATSSKGESRKVFAHSHHPDIQLNGILLFPMSNAGVNLNQRPSEHHLGGVNVRPPHFAWFPRSSVLSLFRISPHAPGKWSPLSMIPIENSHVPGYHLGMPRAMHGKWEPKNLTFPTTQLDSECNEFFFPSFDFMTPPG